MRYKHITLLIILFFQIKYISASELYLIPLSKIKSSTAIVLIGGLNKNYHFLEEWKDSLKESNVSVYGFNDDYRSLPLQESSWNLALELAALTDMGKNRLIIISHSLGGLVAKHALDRMNSYGALSKFMEVELHAMGVPWGGSYAANLFPFLPLSKMVLQIIRYSMLVDLGSESMFMSSLHSPLSANVKFFIYEGSNDTVSMPETDMTMERYETIARSANYRIFLNGINHNDFKKPLIINFNY